MQVIFVERIEMARGEEEVWSSCPESMLAASLWLVLPMKLDAAYIASE